MNGIKKMMGLVLLIVISACSPEANEIETQNTDFEIANSTRSQIENVEICLFVEFAPHISEPQKDEIRMWIAEDGYLLYWEQVEGSASVEKWHISVDLNECGEYLDACGELVNNCPKYEKMKHSETDGDFTTVCDNNNNCR